MLYRNKNQSKKRFVKHIEMKTHYRYHKEIVVCGSKMVLGMGYVEMVLELYRV